MSIKIKIENKLTEDEYEKTLLIYNKCFTRKGEFTDTEISFKEFSQILNKFPNSHSIIRDNNEIIGETWIIPTNKKIMFEFLENKINEKQLIIKSVKKVSVNNFETIYIFYSAILKNYRQKGLIFKGKKNIKPLFKN